MFTAFFIGNIASGKSLATRYLASRGAWRIDMDDLAKSLYEPESEIVNELACAFGMHILDEDGCIITSELARSAFSDSEHAELLNQIVHPHVKERLARMLVPPVCCAASGPSCSLAVVEISVPKSFVDVFDLADEIVAISAPEELRRERALSRGMQLQDFDARSQAQPSEDDLCSLADYVIENVDDMAGLLSAIDAWAEHHDIALKEPSDASFRLQGVLDKLGAARERA